MNHPRLTLRLTPLGRLAVVADDDDAPELDPARARRIEQAFSRGSGHGLLWLGAAEAGSVLPPVFAYWRELGIRHVTGRCTEAGEASPARGTASLAEDELESLASAAPAMPGAEYLTVDRLRALWAELETAFTTELAESGATVQDFLQRLNPAWNVVGRVHFNLAENRRDEEAPFAFLATYSGRAVIRF